MDEGLPIRIIRDIVNRCGLSQLRRVYVSTKVDEKSKLPSKVMDIDPLVETIVLEHLRFALPDSPFLVVAEESSGSQLPTIEQLCKADTIVTVDGIDGTGDFVRHFNLEQRNSKWLMGLTAL